MAFEESDLDFFFTNDPAKRRKEVLWSDIPTGVRFKVKLFDVTHPKHSITDKSKYYRFKAQLKGFTELDIGDGIKIKPEEVLYMDIGQLSFRRAWHLAGIAPLQKEKVFNVTVWFKKHTKHTLRLILSEIEEARKTGDEELSVL